MKKLLLIAALLFPLHCLAQTDAIQGACTQEGVSALTSGLPSTNRLTGIIPFCTVTVYFTRTTTKAPIYSAATGTGSVASVLITAPGSYSVCPTGVTFTGGSGTGAAGFPVCTGTALTGVIITSGGTGYVSPPTVAFTGGTGSGATATSSLAQTLSNPFTADALGSNFPGKWIFFAADGTGYDVVMSGGIPPLTYPYPRTLTDLKVGGGGSGGTCGSVAGDNTSTDCGFGNQVGNTGHDVSTFGYTNVTGSNASNFQTAVGTFNMNVAMGRTENGAFGDSNFNFTNGSTLTRSSDSFAMGENNFLLHNGLSATINEAFACGDSSGDATNLDTVVLCGISAGSMNGQPSASYTEDVCHGDGACSDNPSVTVAYHLDDADCGGNGACAQNSGTVTDMTGHGNGAAGGYTDGSHDINGTGAGAASGYLRLDVPQAFAHHIDGFGDSSAQWPGTGSHHIGGLGDHVCDAAGWVISTAGGATNDCYGLGDHLAEVLGVGSADVYVMGRDIQPSSPGAVVTNAQAIGHDLTLVSNQAELGDTQTTDTELHGQQNINDPTHPSQLTLTYNVGHAPAGLAGAARIAPDTSGDLDVNENNTGFSRICTAGNGVCPATTSLAFSGLTSGTNTAAAMLVGTGASLAPTGSGTITPSQVNLAASGNGGVGGNLPNASLATQTANTVLGALTATNPSGLALPSCSGASNALTWTTSTGFGCNTISGGAVSSVSNSDGTLTVSPTTGAVVASLALGHANTWTATQTFSSSNSTSTSVPIINSSGSGNQYNIEVPGSSAPFASNGLIYHDVINSLYPFWYSSGNNAGIWAIANAMFGWSSNTTDPRTGGSASVLDTAIQRSAAGVVCSATNPVGSSNCNGTFKANTLTLLSGGVLNWNGDTGLSRDSADNVDCGNGTAGDQTCTFHAATGDIAQIASTNVNSATYSTASNCASALSPAVCGSAAAGSVLIPTGTTSSTLTVNTTAVTANSQIVFYPDDSLGTRLSTTCNSTLATLVGGSFVSARTPGTSFTITFNGTILTNGVCGSYTIIN